MDIPSSLSWMIRSRFRVASFSPERNPHARRQLRHRSLDLVVPLIMLAAVVLAYLDYSVLSPPAAGHPAPAAAHPLHRRNGNEVAAADLYGLGVRVGLYLQAIGMLISAANLHAGGVRVACAATTLAYLGCWTKLARAAAFSPCEADLIATLTATAAVAGQIAGKIPDTSIVGTLGLMVAGVWALVNNFWFWATLYRNLPLLGTANLVWCFTAVRLDGGFRIFMLVLLSLQVGYECYQAFVNFVAGVVGVENGVRVVNEEQYLKAVADAVKGYRATVRISVAVAMFTLIFVIAGAEMIIRYNGLQPEQSLATPGQSVPLTIGIIVLLDGVVSIFG